ncbi:MAG: ribosome silencing factor [Phycisphaerales bacterium]|jgi:ribosome-associated protein|nr:ribosome silencing factor [Planctomycetaceae bacterium]MDP6157255.1 ribosome silencing factor [Phycisphaerales bacterium]MDP6310967.1 ribosome silencing factor [Phycisphaerales bacterium]MDP7086878.1 ribosome silencing factor [Phycisphaerales bacterium]MDP7188761.1 ribosome silencing factor [Phycisphaerales bacterium]|tara:strand:- start:2625 stop:3053 length:429 start_codon:yes stop_codon:yes gene_type:complete
MIDRSGISPQTPEPGSETCAPATRGDSLAFAIEAARTAVDRHCTDVRLFDVRGRSQVCDYVLVASGTSDRQVRSVGAELGDLGESFGRQRFRSNADPASTWVVVDFIDIVMHLFEPSRRAYYDLDELWSDAVEIDFSRGSEA